MFQYCSICNSFSLQNSYGLTPFLPSVSARLAKALVRETDPKRQRVLLGEPLYQLVEKLEPLRAPKITGMLLELDHSEILHLVESPEALRAKVIEALDVLVMRMVTDHLESMSSTKPKNKLRRMFKWLCF